MIRTLTFLVLLIISLSCSEDDTTEKNTQKELKITSFKIEENTNLGVRTKTDIEAKGFENMVFEDHGVIIQDNNGGLVKKQHQGALSNTSFTSILNSKIIKGKRYNVFPFVFSNNKYIYGDTLSFISNVDITVKVKQIKPLKGFIYDTITISGKNFCKSQPDTRSQFLLNGNFQNIIFESDTLIKAVITPFIDKLKLSTGLRNCGVDTILPNIFKINPPQLDSISSKESYASENSFLFGKNIHSLISQLWIDNVEVQLNKSRLDIDKLEFTVPEGLPKGLLNLKLKVLDTIIERSEYFQSTTPYITAVDKKETGFLDTLTIKGNYFLQRNGPLDILVGNRSQRILKRTKNELKVIIDNYFEDPSPKIKVKTGNFELEENIIMLPPEIISVNKPRYHLADDTIILKTKYFIADSSDDITIGGVSLRYGKNFTNVDTKGTIRLSMTDWLETDQLYSYYVFNNIGTLHLDIKTSYGSDNYDIPIYPPKISAINGNSFLHGESINLSGLDFGYRRVSRIYIDEKPIDIPANSANTFYNKNITFEVPEKIDSGKHTLKVKTGGQFSNEIIFNVKKITVSRLSRTSGVREMDLFTIYGDNLENNYGYSIIVDGVWCEIINASKNQVSFRLPYHTPLKQNMAVTINYGTETINAGIINGTEPYAKLEDYKLSNSYFTSSTHFEFQKKLYFFNANGIFEFDQSTSSWNLYDTFLYDSYVNSNGNKYVSTIDDSIYISYGDKLLVYDMISKLWKTPITLSLGNDRTHILYAFVTSENEAFLFIEDQSDGYETSFIKYNLANNTIEEVTQPQFNMNISGLGNEAYYHNGKIYFDPRDQNILVYDVNTNTWEDIGFPRDYKFFYDNNLYVYNEILYFSGGQGNSRNQFNLYTYDLTKKVWKQKTPMLLKLGKHAVWGTGNKLYFLLGNGISGYENKNCIVYDINEDPK